MHMKYQWMLALLLLTAFGCRQEAPAVTQDTAARVGKETITEQDVASRLALLSDEDREFAQTPIGRQNLLQIITREKLVAAAAKDEKLDESDVYLSIMDDKRRQLEDIYNEFAAQTLEQLWYDELKEKGETAVSDEEISAYYKKYPYEMTIKQIIIDNAQTADQVLRALKSSPRRWKELERQYSVAPESLRQITVMPGEYLPDIEVIAANSPTGSVQGFFKTAQGFHIIMKTSDKRLSRKDAEPRIRQVLEDRKLDKVLDSLKNKYEVVIYEKSE